MDTNDFLDGLSDHVNATEEEVQKAYELWFEHYKENPDEQPSMSGFTDASAFARQAQQGLFRYVDMAKAELRKSANSD